MRKNKKGWVRIVEAIVALLLIVGFLVIIANSGNSDDEVEISFCN